MLDQNDAFFTEEEKCFSAVAWSMTDAYPNELPDYKDRESCSYYCCGISSGGLLARGCSGKNTLTLNSLAHILSFKKAKNGININYEQF